MGEYGTSDGPCTADWTCMEDARQAIMPKEELQKAFDAGATHVIFWRQKGDQFVVGANYVVPELIRPLKAARGDDKNYAEESAKRQIPVNSKGPVATAARSGMEIVVTDPKSDPNFVRKDLAAEFNIQHCHFTPAEMACLSGASVLLRSRSLATETIRRCVCNGLSCRSGAYLLSISSGHGDRMILKSRSFFRQ